MHVIIENRRTKILVFCNAHKGDYEEMEKDGKSTNERLTWCGI